MTHLHRHKASALTAWVSSLLAENQFLPFKIPFSPTGFLQSAQNPRLFGARTPATDKSSNLGKLRTSLRRKAQSALTEYLHCTRSLQFAASENISRNSPVFLEKLLEKVDTEGDVARSVSRYLRYHPINEFEPFFESIGLKPAEFGPLLPRDLMFLSDSDVLLANYLVLCDYGIVHTKIGKVYIEAREVFQYDYGVLLKKLQAYENLGISQSLLVKAVPCGPYLLTGDIKMEFVEVLDKLMLLGFEQTWVEQQFLEGDSYRWPRILEVFCLFSRMGFTGEQLSELIRKNPWILFEGSGSETFSLIGLLVKFGSTLDEIRAVFLQFPEISVGQFVSNFRNCFIFFMEIEMDAEQIDKLIRSQPQLLGSCNLKKSNSLLVNLNCGKKCLRDMIKENPLVLKNWVMGLRVKRKVPSDEDEKSLIQKKKFLLGLGFVEGSKDMERALKVFRGKGQELQERFDCLVEAGLDREDVFGMLSVSPQILNQTKDVIEMKLDFLVNELNFPLTNLTRFPAYLSFKIERIRVRVLMFKWLRDQGLVDPLLALSTLVACSDKVFIEQYVNRHASGLKVWEDLKERFVDEKI